MAEMFECISFLLLCWSVDGLILIWDRLLRLKHMGQNHMYKTECRPIVTHWQHESGHTYTVSNVPFAWHIQNMVGVQGDEHGGHCSFSSTLWTCVDEHSNLNNEISIVFPNPKKSWTHPKKRECRGHFCKRLILINDFSQLFFAKIILSVLIFFVL